MHRLASQLVASVGGQDAAHGAGEADRVLLDRFVRQRDEAAFTTLVARHGPLVLGAARRVLGDTAAAEDVFQAAFLVLARKADSLRWRAGLGPWLHGVTVLLARKARSRRCAVATDPAALATVPAPAVDPAAALTWCEVRGALDEELARLPAALRDPLVLCYLQARTRDEAAAVLGVSLAKIKRRLERARNLLHARLTRRGVTLAAAGWALVLTSPPVSAGVSRRTAHCAAAFAESGAAPPGLAELVGSATGSSARWLCAPALLAVVVGVGLFAAPRAPDAPPPGPRAHAPGPVAPAGPDDALPPGAAACLGAAGLQDFTIDRCAAFSPAGRFLATGGANSPIRVWDVATGRLVASHRTRGSVGDLRFKPDGRLVALTFFGHDVFLMQEFTVGAAPDAGEEKRLDAEATRRASGGDRARRDLLRHYFLSTDGTLAVAVFEYPWQPGGATGRRAEVFRFAPGAVSDTAEPERRVELPPGDGVWLSGDGKVLLAHVAPLARGQPGKLAAYPLAGKKGNKEVSYWEFAYQGGEKRRPMSCLSADGRRVVVLAADESVELWDGPAGGRLHPLPGLPIYYFHGGGERGGIDLSRDGKRLALVRRGETGEVGGRVIDLDTGKDVCTLAPQPTARLGAARLNGDGTRVAVVGGGAARLWDARTGADACPLPGHRGPVNSLVFDAASKAVVTAGDDLTVRAWEPTTGKELWRTAFPQLMEVRFATPAGVVVVEQGPSGRRAAFLDPATGAARPLPGKLGEEEGESPLALAPDGKSVVTLAVGKPALRVCSWPGGELRAEVPLSPPENARLSRCEAASFTPDGKQFVAILAYDGSGEGQKGAREPDRLVVERWDLAGKRLLGRLDADTRALALVAHPTGLFALASDGRVFDAATEREIVKLSLAEALSVPLSGRFAAALSPDGRTLAVGDPHGGQVLLFEMRTGKLRGRLTHPGDQRGGLWLVFLPDGRLVSGGSGALVWSAESLTRP